MEWRVAKPASTAPLFSHSSGESSKNESARATKACTILSHILQPSSNNKLLKYLTIYCVRMCLLACRVCVCTEIYSPRAFYVVRKRRNVIMKNTHTRPACAPCVFVPRARSFVYARTCTQGEVGGSLVAVGGGEKIRHLMSYAYYTHTHTLRVYSAHLVYTHQTAGATS